MILFLSWYFCNELSDKRKALGGSHTILAQSLYWTEAVSFAVDNIRDFLGETERYTGIFKQSEGGRTDDTGEKFSDAAQYQQCGSPFADHFVRHGRTPKPIGVFRQETIQVGYASTVECADSVTGYHQGMVPVLQYPNQFVHHHPISCFSRSTYASIRCSSFGISIRCGQWTLHWLQPMHRLA